jgi:hypothetical protein
MWLFIPVATSLLLSLRQPIFLSRNLIAASLGYYLLIAGIIWRFRSKRATLALLLPLVAMNLVSIGYNHWWEPKEDWRAVANCGALHSQEPGEWSFHPGYTELFLLFQGLRHSCIYPGLSWGRNPAQLSRIRWRILAKCLRAPYIWLVVRDIESADQTDRQDLADTTVTCAEASAGDHFRAHHIRWDRFPKQRSNAAKMPKQV